MTIRSHQHDPRDPVTVFVVVLMFLAALSTGCGDGATEPNRSQPTSIAVRPDTHDFDALKASTQLEATVLDQMGQTITGLTIGWSSTEPSVASVNGAGLVVAEGNGTTTIVASVNGLRDTASVTVAQAVVEIGVSAASDTLVVGDTLRFEAQATDRNGYGIDITVFAWSTGDTSVAAVNQQGLVSGTAPGDTDISAEANGVSGYVALRVIPRVPASLVVTPDSVAFAAIGQTTEVSVEVRDQTGRTMPDIEVTWTSADTSVVAVDSTGLLTSTGPGTTTVSAVAGQARAQVSVNVMQSISLVTLSPAIDTVLADDTLRLVAEAVDENGYRVVDATFSWMSSDQTIAVVDSTGLVTGVALHVNRLGRGSRRGDVMITATAGDLKGTSAIAVVNPDRPPLVALYEATDGPYWNNAENWLSDQPLHQWHGVSVDSTGRVTGLSLGGNGLSGQIPTDITHLPELRLIRLGSNSLSGPIPADLTIRVAEPRLVGNSFYRSVLGYLSLAGNELSGPIPDALGDQLEGMYAIDLSNNDLSGPVPDNLANIVFASEFCAQPYWPCRLNLSHNNLSGPIPAQLGNVPDSVEFNLSHNSLSGPLPVELGHLRASVRLDLSHNNLSGPLPAAIGSLLGILDLRHNELTGLVPESFTMSVGTIGIGNNNGLCLPGTKIFAEWVTSRGGVGVTTSFCHHSEVRPMKEFYLAMRGDDWRVRDGWNGDWSRRLVDDYVLGEWYGVETDSAGRVTRIDLSSNGLSGLASAIDLNALTELEAIDVSTNDLSGRLPLSLTSSTIDVLRYGNTEICIPDDDSIREWLSSISVHDGSGISCEARSDRDILELFYKATSVDFSWVRSTNWLTDKPISTWYGISVNAEGRVMTIRINGNNLSGTIPADLAGLDKLETLDIRYNRLRGAIPPEIGELRNLRVLVTIGPFVGGGFTVLADNYLTGALPPELGKLSNLERMEVGGLDAIPSDFGNLARLESLWLRGVSGPIPPELGRLSRLEDLEISGADLSGSIPAELGDLRPLKSLTLRGTGVSGSVPATLGRLSDLRVLDLANTSLEGPLPAEFTALEKLETLGMSGTSLCAPNDPRFDQWLTGIERSYVAACSPVSAYLTQAVQSSRAKVPLIAGEPATLRVFLTSNERTMPSDTIPATRASFYRNGSEIHVVDIPGKNVRIPSEVEEGLYYKSVLAAIPGDVIQPGLEMVVDVDPDGMTDPRFGLPTRIPATGRMAVGVETVPPLDLTIVPFISNQTHDSTLVANVEEAASNPHGHPWLTRTSYLMPVAEMAVNAHAPVVTSTSARSTLLSETAAIRRLEGKSGHYMGMMLAGNGGGIATLGGRASVSLHRKGWDAQTGEIVAHELGHNFNLRHAPCSVSAPVWYPHPDGSIGAWGWNWDWQQRRRHVESAHLDGIIVPPETSDVMSYCSPKWISDHHFNRALEFRIEHHADSRAMATAREESLLFWGRIDSFGAPVLEPAFVVNAPPALPAEPGEHVITGRDGSGHDLFSFSFAMPRFDDEDLGSVFAFVLPLEKGWEGLANITLTGPGGEATLDGQTDQPMMILHDSTSGEVHGILRGHGIMQADHGLSMRSTVLVSRGLPTMTKRENP